MRDSDLHQDMGYLPQREAEHLRAIFDLPELPEGAHIVHHYHHSEPSKPTVNVKVERNTKGYNREISVSGTHQVDEAMKLMDEARKEIESRYFSGLV